MKIRMQTLYAGPKGVMENGRVYDVDPAQAKVLIDGRFAVAVAPVAAAVIETTAAPVEVIETAVIDQPSAPVYGKKPKK